VCQKAGHVAWHLVPLEPGKSGSRCSSDDDPVAKPNKKEKYYFKVTNILPYGIIMLL
jgi:hypothetical protein